MTATAQPQAGAPAAARAEAGYPAGSLRFDWIMTALSALFLGGLWVDGWAHYHGKVDGSFFTPYHALFYSAFGLIALFLAYHQVRNVNRGYAFRRALPRGYWLSLIGAAVFALGGVGDLIWHTLFGIEGGTEALLSPTHILLALGMLLILSGPARAAWLRASEAGGRKQGWVALGPMLVSMTLVMTLLMFFTGYASPVVYPYVFNGALRLYNNAPVANDILYQDMAVTTMLFQAFVLSAVSVLLLWSWKLPFGAFMLLFGVSTAMLTLLTDVYPFIPAALVTGLLVDLLVLWLRPSPSRFGQMLVLAFAAPALFYACYFAAVQLLDGIHWSIHVWTGAIFLTGVVGLMLAVVIRAAGQSPRLTQADGG